MPFEGWWFQRKGLKICLTREVFHTETFACVLQLQNIFSCKEITASEVSKIFGFIDMCSLFNLKGYMYVALDSLTCAPYST